MRNCGPLKRDWPQPRANERRRDFSRILKSPPKSAPAKCVIRRNVLQGNGTTFSTAVTQTFEFPGKGTLRKAIANKNIEIAELGLEQFRLALTEQVRLLAYEHLASVSEAEAAESVYRQSNVISSQLASQTGFGARQQIEIRLIQASLVELGVAIKEASLRREETRTKLNALLGLPQSMPLRIRDEAIGTFRRRRPRA